MSTDGSRSLPTQPQVPIRRYNSAGSLSSLSTSASRSLLGCRFCRNNEEEECCLFDHRGSGGYIKTQCKSLTCIGLTVQLCCEKIIDLFQILKFEHLIGVKVVSLRNKIASVNRVAMPY